MPTLIVNSWASLQSYKDRRPPWIRLHRTLLDNFEYHSMSANARALLPMLWLLASEHTNPLSGIIPYDENKIAFRLRLSLADVQAGICECISAGFISRNENVTDPYSVRNETVTPETETETETETEINPQSETVEHSEACAEIAFDVSVMPVYANYPKGDEGFALYCEHNKLHRKWRDDQARASERAGREKQIAAAIEAASCKPTPEQDELRRYGLAGGQRR